MDLNSDYFTSVELQEMGMRVGNNVRIHKKASVYGAENIIIGDNVRIDDFCVLVATGPLVIGSFVHIPPFCFLGAKFGIFIGDYVSFAHGVKVYSSADDYSGEKLTGCMVDSAFVQGGDRVEIKNHCIIGANSIVLPGVVMEEGVAVGALSLVKGRLEEFGIYAGIPAKRIKDRSRNMLELMAKNFSLKDDCEK